MGKGDVLADPALHLYFPSEEHREEGWVPLPAPGQRTTKVAGSLDSGGGEEPCEVVQRKASELVSPLP